MPVRSGVLIELVERDGCTGWGEAWCNFPPGGNLAKISLFREVIGPALLRAEIRSWSEARPVLERSLGRMILHTGEPGPFSHCLAAIDMALADIAARRRNVPLSRLLSASPAGSVPVYASTPRVEEMEEVIPRLREAGHDAVKLKIGYGAQTDRSILGRFRAANGSMSLMVDANQSWGVEDGKRALAEIADWQPDFVEEPLRADAELSEWTDLAAASPLHLAAGENILDEKRFSAHVDAKSLRVVQPDVAKWGGVSGAFAVGRYALANDARCALHFMGTAVGLAASFHTMAALGGSGRVELDANDNPLRTELGDLNLTVDKGRVHVSGKAGIGFVPDREALRRFSVGDCELRA